MRGSARRFAAVISLVAGAALGTGLAGPPGSVEPVGATTPTCPSPLTLSSTVSPPGGNPFIVCSGRIPSFDGTPLDTDLSLPIDASGPRPLIVMMHGWGDDKTQWESTTLTGNSASEYDWNSAWFASQGFAVLTYTARGFYESCGKDPTTGYTYSNDPDCSGRASWTHLSDRRWEIADTQYLVGLLVDDGIAKPDKIVATGDSYGGGQSWLLALSQDRVVSSSSTNPNELITKPWTSPKGVPIHLAAAIPQYPWTDLLSALVQNGRASDGFFGAPPAGSDAHPLGVEKQSYVSGLYAEGQAYGQFANPGSDPTADLSTWFSALNAGEPYKGDPEVKAAVTQVSSAFRSPYAVAVPTGSNEVPVFFMQGDTDPLFPAIQGLQMVNRLLAVNPSYPVWAFYGDLGHSYADNPLAMWEEANGLANTWLDDILGGQTPSIAHVTVTTTPCWGSQTIQTYTAKRYQKIPTTTLTVDSTSSQTTANSNASEPEAVETDPVANSGCRVISAGTDQGVASWTWDVPGASTLLGSPVLHTTVTVDGTNAEIAARLWEVDPATGMQALVSRTVYRITTKTVGAQVPVAFELFPNAWQVACGDEIKLELTQDDSPYWRADNLTSSLTYAGVNLTLPAVGGTSCGSG